MPKDKSTIGEKKSESSIVEGWNAVIKKYHAGKLNEQEKAQFDRARFSEEQAKKNSFVLGGQINRSF
ncbi:MAG: hypothetical protein Q8M34_07135 [Thermodesulfovibrionales bacterium]|nr:hypothetical protein [Thermodesulfovibrionales bacterium]